ncbi:hypothetical protein M9H77_19222 [Catharanthus roseus]|uniref:Uncharacterized protein n=1 Tax=Catharanthus roseus TaxID=4058 RepID=A0ACC0B9S1_CATRO|nr:hypothetical protein M9H77_19222 [Catharanthus roseus]
MHKRSFKQRSKRSLKTIRLYEEVIKLKTLKARRMIRDSFIGYLWKLEETLQKLYPIFSQALSLARGLDYGSGLGMVQFTDLMWAGLVLGLMWAGPAWTTINKIKA